MDDAHLNRMFISASWALRVACPRDVDEFPIYLVDCRIDDRLAGNDFYAWTSNLLDIRLKPWLQEHGKWQGRGFAACFNIARLVAEDRASFGAILSCAAHEFAHFLTWRKHPACEIIRRKPEAHATPRKLEAHAPPQAGSLRHPKRITAKCLTLVLDATRRCGRLYRADHGAHWPHCFLR